jgi:hypothetical protein
MAGPAVHVGKRLLERTRLHEQRVRRSARRSVRQRQLLRDDAVHAELTWGARFTVTIATTRLV